MTPISRIRDGVGHVSARAAVLLAAFLFALPFLNPIRRLPLPTFDSECLAALLLAASLAALLFAPSTKVRMNWPLPALLAAMVALAAYQYLAGQLDYSYRLTTLVLAVVGMLMAYGLGRWIVERSLVPTAMHAICIAIVAGGVLSHAVQWM